MFLVRFWGVVWLLVLGVLPGFAQNRVSGQVIGVPAGDRIRVQFEGWQVTVQLHGVASPTTPPSLVERLREYTARRVEGTRVTVEVRGTGPKQTLYGEVFTSDSPMRSLNEELVQEGLATWTRQYAPKRAWLGKLEQDARSAARGMWGDPSGAGIPLPPVAFQQAQPRATSTATASEPTSNSTTVVAPTPIPTVAPGATETTRRVESPKSSAATPFQVSDAFLWVLVFLAAATLGMLQWRSAWNLPSLPAHIGLALAVGGAGALLLPVLWAMPHLFAQGVQTWVPGGAALLAVLCLWASFALCRREQILRATGRTPIARLQAGFRRVQGEVSAPLGLVESKAGHIPAIYVHEVTHRCEAHGERPVNSRGPRRTTPHSWVKIEDETHVVDFQLSDDTGAVIVQPDRATFRPLRVARFYNDIPVETFFDNPYGGDTRTEVYFIPATANLVVWGRANQPLVAAGDTPAWRIGFDPLAENLLIVEENPNRVYTSRPLWGLLLTLLAVVLTVAAMATLLPMWSAKDGLAHPGVALVALVVGIAGVALLGGAFQTVTRRTKALESAWRELDAAWLQRAERLENAMPGVAALIPAAGNATRRVREAVAQAADAPNRPARLRAEAEVGNTLRTLLNELDRAGGDIGDTIADLRIELRAREEYLRDASERYNAAAYAANGLRSGVATGLVSRALSPEPAPEIAAIRDDAGEA